MQLDEQRRAVTLDQFEGSTYDLGLVPLDVDLDQVGLRQVVLGGEVVEPVDPDRTALCIGSYTRHSGFEERAESRLVGCLVERQMLAGVAEGDVVWVNVPHLVELEVLDEAPEGAWARLEHDDTSGRPGGAREEERVETIEGADVVDRLAGQVESFQERVLHRGAAHPLRDEREASPCA